MLQLIEAQARELAKKADRLADREVAHDAQNLHSAIVSLLRLETRREAKKTASNCGENNRADVYCALDPAERRETKRQPGGCFDAD